MALFALSWAFRSGRAGRLCQEAEPMGVFCPGARPATFPTIRLEPQLAGPPGVLMPLIFNTGFHQKVSMQSVIPLTKKNLL